MADEENANVNVEMHKNGLKHEYEEASTFPKIVQGEGVENIFAGIVIVIRQWQILNARALHKVLKQVLGLPDKVKS